MNPEYKEALKRLHAVAIDQLKLFWFLFRLWAFSALILSTILFFVFWILGAYSADPNSLVSEAHAQADRFVVYFMNVLRGIKNDLYTDSW